MEALNYIKRSNKHMMGIPGENKAFETIGKLMWCSEGITHVRI